MSEIPQPMEGGKIKRAFSEFPTDHLDGIGNLPYGSKFSRVYMSTRSGNMYRLDRYGRLINRDVSIKGGDILGLRFEPTKWAGIVIKKGQVFPFPNGGHTSEVTEIVAVEESSRGGKEPKDSVIRRFNTGLPKPIPNIDPSIEIPGQVTPESDSL